jgi:hypothetical protein
VTSIAVVASGTQNAVLHTEHTLGAALTDPEVYVLAVNLSNMQAGDTTILRVKPKVRSGGAAALAFEQSFSGEQSEAVAYSEPVPSAHSCTFTLEQTDGTGRSYEWSVLKVI